jgi:6-phosphogluconolactonase
MLHNNWSVFEDIDKLSKQLASDILYIAKNSIKLNDSFKIVLAGGKSLVETYKILSNMDSDWGKWHVYIGDERCLPLEDEDRNDYVINKAWLNNSPVLKENIHFMSAELGAYDGALHYNKILECAGDFDVVLLSIGEDGHTASLFPGHSYDDNKNVVIERNSPKYPKNRISMSYSRFNQSRNVFKIISGSSKCNIVKQWLNNIQLPIRQINGDSEKVYISQDALS